MRKPARGRGFSLLEILVVVVIIGMLAGAVGWKVSDYMSTARVNRAKSDIATIVDAVEAHQVTHGRYPTNDEGLGKLPLKNRLDPWGYPYEYNYPGENGDFDVFSLGRDNRPGGEGEDADIFAADLGKAPEGA
jgi:general secretion pathway protein G